MSLKNISLSPFVLAELYKAPLISNSLENTEDISTTTAHLGHNQKHISIFINNERNAWLPDDLYQLLTNILQACHLNMKDVALINVAHYKDKSLSDFVTEFSSQKIIFLGSTFQNWLEDTDKKNEVYSKENFTYLISDSLQEMQDDKIAKKEFWQGIQVLFNLKKRG